MKKFLMQAAVVLVVSSCAVMAQEQKPAPQASKIDPSRLLLEVRENRNHPPGYSEINRAGESKKWVWVTRFERIPGREASGKPISAIRFEPVFNGETVDVKVTLLRGTKGFEQEDLVGVYQVGIGEQKTIGELDQFGIEPIKISVAHTVPPVPPPPSFENKTKAIEVVSVQAENLPRPAYKLTIRNVSDKNISTVRIDTTFDGRRAGAVNMHGEDGRAVLQPGDVAERWISAATTVTTPTGYAPGVPSAVTIKISTVVFDDMSFEGELETACSMEGFVIGRRIWLKRLVTLLDQELSKLNGDHVEAAKQFKEKLSALSFDLDESEMNKASSVAPECDKPAKVANVVMNGMKVDLVRELERIITSKPGNFKTWLEDRRTRYSAWLARI